MAKKRYPWVYVLHYYLIFWYCLAVDIHNYLQDSYNALCILFSQQLRGKEHYLPNRSLIFTGPLKKRCNCHCYQIPSHISKFSIFCLYIFVCTLGYLKYFSISLMHMCWSLLKLNKSNNQCIKLQTKRSIWFPNYKVCSILKM